MEGNLPHRSHGRANGRFGPLCPPPSRVVCPARRTYAIGRQCLLYMNRTGLPVADCFSGDFSALENGYKTTSARYQTTHLDWWSPVVSGLKFVLGRGREARPAPASIDSQTVKIHGKGGSTVTTAERKSKAASVIFTWIPWDVAVRDRTAANIDPDCEGRPSWSSREWIPTPACRALGACWGDGTDHTYSPVRMVGGTLPITSGIVSRPKIRARLVAVGHSVVSEEPSRG